MAEHLGICLNLARLALSQYANYNFNSFCELGGQHLAAGEGGIFVIDSADDDDGTDIHAFFEPFITDMGIINVKRMRVIDFGYESNGALKVTVETDEAQTQAIYILPAGASRLQGGGRARGRRDQKGRYWKYKVENTDGCDFSVDLIEVTPIILARNRK